MDDLQELVEHLAATYVPGAAALVDRDGEVEIAVAGIARADCTPLRRDAIVRIASITKPIVAALTMTLVEDGTLALDAPVARWLPELARPTVLRTPDSELDDVVAADRAITVEDLLTFTHGLGFPPDFDLPICRSLFGDLLQGPPQPQRVPPPDEWMRRVGETPLLAQPGTRWTYNLAADILGVLLARAAGTSLPKLLRQRIFGPLDMDDTGFDVDPSNRHRLTDYWVADDSGALHVHDAADSSEWATEPAFPSAAGGLVSTLQDCWRFGQMLRNSGSVDGTQVLTPASVDAMTTNRLSDEQIEGAGFFLEGQGWGYGGSVDHDGPERWNVAGRYGWVGGTGTAAHVTRSRGLVTVLLTQVQVGGPSTGAMLHEFWSYAAGARP